MTGQGENQGVSSFRAHLVPRRPGSQWTWDLVCFSTVTLGELLTNFLKGPRGSLEGAGRNVTHSPPPRVHVQPGSSHDGGAQHQDLGRTLGSVACAGLKALPTLALQQELPETHHLWASLGSCSQ